jgi:hypothetical protein
VAQEVDKKINTEDYYKDWIRRLMKQSIDRHSILKSQMSLCYDYFHGTQGDTGFTDLFSGYDIQVGDNKLTTPVVYMNLNKIKTKVNTLIGDLIDLGFEASANAVNKEAKTRKQDYKLKVLADMSIKPLMDSAAEESGINIASEVDDDEDIKEKLENYKDISERAIEACLRYTVEYWSYRYLRLQFLLDAVAAGECHARTSIINGMPKISRVQPLNTFYPRNVNDDDFLSKTQGIGEVYYSDVREVTERFKLKSEDVAEMQERLKNNVSSSNGEYYVEFDNQKFFEPYETGQARVLVSSWEWVDIEKVAGVEAVYENGLETFEVLVGEEATKKVDKRKYADAVSFKVVRKERNVLKKATLIADKYLVEYGNVENQPTFYTDYGHTTTSITSYRPLYINGQSKSMVMDIMQTQDFINYLWTKVQLEITKSNGSVTRIDVSRLPKEWGDGQSAINTMFHYLKGHGVEFYNSQQNEGAPIQGGGSSNTTDSGLGNTITGLMNLMSFTDNEMKSISGMNDARQGVIQSANQLNGVTEMAIAQSAKSSKGFYSGFFMFESKLLTKHAQHIRISWKNNPDRWRDIIGDLYIDFLEIDEDIADDEHEIVVRNQIMPRSVLEKYIVAGLQHNLPLHEGLELEMSSQEDIKGAVVDYIAVMKKKEKEQQAQQMQMQQMQQQAMLANTQAQAQAGQQTQQAITEREREKTQYKGNVDLQKTAMKEDTKKALSKEKLV